LSSLEPEGKFALERLELAAKQGEEIYLKELQHIQEEERKATEETRKLSENDYQIEMTSLKYEYQEAMQGQILGFFICIIALGVGAYIATQVEGVSGGIAGGLIGASGVTGLAAVFVKGRVRPPTKK
jgi:hypothetical protein